MIYVALALTIALLTSVYINYLFFRDVTTVDSFDIGPAILSQSEAHRQRIEHDESFRETKEERVKESSEQAVKVALFDGHAYWITEAGLYTAPLDEDEEVEYDLKKPVDAHAMSQDQIDMMLEILDALKEDDDEGSSTGK